MSHADHRITDAIAIWEPLAAFAWERLVTEGRGVVLIERTELQQAASEMRSGADPAAMRLRLGYVCARDVPPSDDFAPILAEYDPNRQVALLVRDDDGSEQLYVLETSEKNQRPSPRDCYSAREAHDEAS